MEVDDAPDAATYLEHETTELYEQRSCSRRSHTD